MLLQDLRPNTNYFLTLKRPYRNEVEKLHVRLQNIYERENTNVPHIVTFQEVLTDPIEVARRHPKHFTSIPFDWIVAAESLHDVIGELMIDDVVFAIDEYV